MNENKDEETKCACTTSNLSPTLKKQTIHSRLETVDLNILRV